MAQKVAVGEDVAVPDDGGRQVIILNSGEDVPSDDGYRPLRYGRLALHLRSQGFQVTRISPSFSHFRREQRPTGRFTSDEGTHIVLKTPGYDRTVGRDRLTFISRFLSQAHQCLISEQTAGAVVIASVPPTGAIATCRRAIGKNAKLIADVRDLWPDAMAVGRPKHLELPLRLAGRVTSQELALADRVLAVTGTMAAWAPGRTGAVPIPIGVPVRPESTVVPTSGLKVCFLSNHTHGFDFETVLAAWKTFVQDCEFDATLDFIGAEPAEPAVRRIMNSEPTIGSLGRKMPGELPDLLASYDVGLVPSKPEWSYSVGNKVFDYLASGLFVLHSMNDSVVDALQQAELGSSVDLDEQSWVDAFASCATDLSTIRASREERADRAQALFGVDAVCSRIEEVIVDLLSESVDRSQVAS